MHGSTVNIDIQQQTKKRRMDWDPLELSSGNAVEPKVLHLASNAGKERERNRKSINGGEFNESLRNFLNRRENVKRKLQKLRHATKVYVQT